MSDDLIKRSDAIKALRRAYFDKDIQSAKDDPCIVDAMTDWAIRQIKSLSSVDRPSAVDLSSVYSTAYKSGYDKGYADAVQGVADEMVKQGKYIADDRPQGEWIDTKGGWRCTACNKWANCASDFCPNCGARMKGAGDEEVDVL